MDTIARLTGWKFATLLEELKKPSDVTVIVDRVKTIFAEPYPIMGNAYHMSLKLGAAINNPLYKHPLTILKSAVSALQTAQLNTGEEAWPDATVPNKDEK